jgi:peptidoglycan LD-endopeptidase LytH
MKSDEIITLLRKHQKDFYPVVPFDEGKDRLLQVDFTENNHELTDDILNDTSKFTTYINNKLAMANAKYGIGGYAEHRTLYRMSELFGSSKVSSLGEDPPTGQAGLGGIEPRRLHLGIDIWGKPYTKVIAPLEGIVHSYAFNDGFGNYGVTIILAHSLDGVGFYTLYGHLSMSSIKNIYEGDRINAGDVFAEFGIPVENGHWPPHLHFQIIIDIDVPIAPDNYRDGRKGDYPGVCKYSEREMYLNNCPDPDLILQMMKYVN